MKLSNELLKAKQAKWAKEHYLEKLKARESRPTNLQRVKLSKRRFFKARTSALKNIKVTQALSYEVNWLSKQKREAKRESKGIKTPPPIRY